MICISKLQFHTSTTSTCPTWLNYNMIVMKIVYTPEFYSLSVILFILCITYNTSSKYVPISYISVLCIIAT